MAHHPDPTRWRVFVPRLAGANFHDRVIACIGAGLGLLIAAYAGIWVQNVLPSLPFLIAPVGASAVLVFAVPASPLAQPWPVLGGNVVSACVGVATAHLVTNPIAAVSIALAFSILAMSLLRCLHPPSGAVALTAILGGNAVVEAGYLYPVSLVAANSLALLCAGIAFHRFSGHSYPHRAQVTEFSNAIELRREDIDQAVREAGDTFDINPDDLGALLVQAEILAVERRKRR